MRNAPMTPKRCSWASVDSPLLLQYHDREWGVSASGNLPTFTRVRVTRCRSLTTSVPDFAVLYSLKCRSLPAFGPKNGPRADADLARPNRCQAHHHRP